MLSLSGFGASTLLAGSWAQPPSGTRGTRLPNFREHFDQGNLVLPTFRTGFLLSARKLVAFKYDNHYDCSNMCQLNKASAVLNVIKAQDSDAYYTENNFSGPNLDKNHKIKCR